MEKTTQELSEQRLELTTELNKHKKEVEKVVKEIDAVLVPLAVEKSNNGEKDFDDFWKIQTRATLDTNHVLRHGTPEERHKLKQLEKCKALVKQIEFDLMVSGEHLKTTTFLSPKMFMDRKAK